MLSLIVLNALSSVIRLLHTQALLVAAKSERSSAVRKAYTSTAAQLARFASETRVGKLLDEAVSMFNDAEGGDRDARLLAGDLLLCNSSTIQPLLPITIAAVVYGSSLPRHRSHPLWPYPPPTGMIVREMARQAPDLLSRNAAAVMPLAYTARMDEDSEVADLWKEVRGHCLPLK